MERLELNKYKCKYAKYQPRSQGLHVVEKTKTDPGNDPGNEVARNIRFLDK